MVNESERPQASEDELRTEESYYDLSKRPKPAIMSGGRAIVDFVKSLKPGMDLANQCSPTFALKPMSILEWFSHLFKPSSHLLKVGENADPEKRILIIAKYLLGGISTIPQKGIQQCKGYNSILGEQFKCTWKHPCGSDTTYKAEQVSHHPPISAFSMQNKERKLYMEATLKPNVTLTSSLTSPYILGKFEGRQIIKISTPTGEETYNVQLPSFAARNLLGLFGDSYGEVVDHLIITSGLFELNLTFKSSQKVTGRLIDTKNKKKLYKIQGVLSDRVVCTNYATKKTSLLFAKANEDKEAPSLSVAPVIDQTPKESRRVWHRVTRAILLKKNSEASEAKNEIEEFERKLRKARDAGVVDKFTPIWFKPSLNANGKVISYAKSVPHHTPL